MCAKYFEIPLMETLFKKKIKVCTFTIVEMLPVHLGDHSLMCMCLI